MSTSNYAQVQNGQIVQIGLPDTGIIDGRTVSNYDLLPNDVLRAQGWIPCTEIQPDYDTGTQQLVVDSEMVSADGSGVTIAYKAVSIT